MKKASSLIFVDEYATFPVHDLREERIMPKKKLVGLRQKLILWMIKFLSFSMSVPKWSSMLVILRKGRGAIFMFRVGNRRSIHVCWLRIRGRFPMRGSACFSGNYLGIVESGAADEGRFSRSSGNVYALGSNAAIRSFSPVGPAEKYQCGF